MRIRAGYEIIYDCPAPVPMLLLLNVHPSRQGDLDTPDTLVTDPPVPVRYFLDGHGNCCGRILAPAGRIVLSSDFVKVEIGRAHV